MAPAPLRITGGLAGRGGPGHLRAEARLGPPNYPSLQSPVWPAEGAAAAQHARVHTQVQAHAHGTQVYGAHADLLPAQADRPSVGSVLSPRGVRRGTPGRGEGAGTAGRSAQASDRLPSQGHGRRLGEVQSLVPNQPEGVGGLQSRGDPTRAPRGGAEWGVKTRAAPPRHPSAACNRGPAGKVGGPLEGGRICRTGRESSLQP